MGTTPKCITTKRDACVVFSMKGITSFPLRKRRDDGPIILFYRPPDSDNQTPKQILPFSLHFPDPCSISKATVYYVWTVGPLEWALVTAQSVPITHPLLTSKNIEMNKKSYRFTRGLQGTAPPQCRVEYPAIVSISSPRIDSLQTSRDGAYFGLGCVRIWDSHGEADQLTGRLFFIVAYLGKDCPPSHPSPDLACHPPWFRNGRMNPWDP